MLRIRVGSEMFIRFSSRAALAKLWNPPSTLWKARLRVWRTGLALGTARNQKVREVRQHADPGVPSLWSGPSADSIAVVRQPALSRLLCGDRPIAADLLIELEQVLGAQLLRDPVEDLVRPRRADAAGPPEGPPAAPRSCCAGPRAPPGPPPRDPSRCICPQIETAPL